MHNIILSKQQAKTLAQSFYGDIHQYCQDNFARFHLWFVNKGRKKMGLGSLTAFDPNKSLVENLTSTSKRFEFKHVIDEQKNELVMWLEIS
jgi:hypothetical protein